LDGFTTKPTYALSTVLANFRTVTGSIGYVPEYNGAQFSPRFPLALNTSYTLTVIGGSSGVRDLAGNALATSYTSSFTTASTFTVANPRVVRSFTDTTAISIEFSEQMKKESGPNGAENVGNFSLESPVGTPVSLNGKTISYDPLKKQSRISGLALTAGATYKVTVNSAAQSLFGAAMDTSGTPAQNTHQGTVISAGLTGGQAGTVIVQDRATTGMMPNIAFPRVKLAGATTAYELKFKVSTAVPAGSTIRVKFPLGTNLAAVALATPGSESFFNSDMNGPGTGTVILSTGAETSGGANNDGVTLDANDSRIAILTLGAVGISANDYVQIDLKGVVNTTLAADRNTSSGHTINIETLNTSRDTLDSITTEAFFLGEQGARVISGRVLRADGVTGLNGARIGVFSHLLGAGQMVTTANNAAGGGQDGEYLVSGISDGEYNLGVDPSSPAIVATNEQPPSFHEPIIIAGSDVLNRNFARSSAPRTITINITGGPANKSVDVFANGQNCSAMRTISLDGSGAASTSLRVQNNVTCSVGMGPALPKDPNFRGGITQFDFMPPPFQTVVIATSNPDAITFALSTTNRTISGTVVDGSGTGIPNVELWARPISTGAGGGSPGKTGSDGSFTINVVDGTYIIAAGFPGLPFIESTPVTVNATGQSPLAASVVIKLAKTSLTISGNVTDADGNGIPYAEIWAEEITSITDERPRGGRPPVPSKADSQGAYTVYVNAGVWKVHAGTSGYGYLGNQITTVSDSSVTLRNFSPSLNGTQYALSGRIMQNSTNVAGAKIFARATSGMGGNRTDSDSTTGESNNYSLKLYDGTYDIGGMLPDGSELPFTRVTINGANATQNIDVGAAITVTVNVTTGAAAITDAFVDVRNAQGFGQGTSKNSRSGVNGVYIIKVPAGSTYTVRASRNGIPIGTEITGVTTTSTQTVTAGTSYTVSGTVTSGATNIEGAWVALVGTPTGRSNPINIGGITLSNGTYSISGIPAGTYKVSANKPGYMDATPSTVTVTNASIENQNRSLTTAARTISGTISRSDGGAASSGFVEAINTSTSEVVVDDIDTNGAYTVSVNAGTWRVKARLDGYVSSEATVTVTSDANATQNITAAPITGYTVRSPYKVSYTANQGGIHTDPNIGANFRLSMPANALGTTADSASLSSKLTTSVPSTSSAQPLGGKGITLSATNSSGRPITSLNDKATISIPYDEADLPAGKTENDLIIGYFDITANDWKPVECVQDKTNDVFTCTTNHFSDFAPLVTSTSVPTPTGLGATASAATTVSLSWTVASGATSYNIYRSTSANGTFARLGSEPTVSSGSTTTYSDTSVSASTAYYYKISSKDATGESSASDAVSVTTPAAAASSNSGSSGSSGSSSSTGGGPLPVSTPSVQPSTPSTSTTPATPAQPATPTVSPAVPAVPASPALENRVRQIERITSESKVLTHGAPQEVAAAVGKTRDEKQEARIEKNIVSRVVPRTATESIRETVTSFVTYGTMETESLGAGERAGVVDSYKSIYGKLPTSETDWQDVMKIAVGRFPSQRNEKAEKYNAEKMFERIYKRTADRTNAHDDAAVVVMTYGLRPADRNQSEAAAIKSYKAIFGAAPSSAYDWDVVRAIAYSGAKR
jgi:hypothetical protein